MVFAGARKHRLVNLKTCLFLASALFLTACGGGGGSSEGSSSAAAQPPLFIAGGGVKGPLAFAKVELYGLDTRFEQLYDSGNPLASATTDAYAQITDLAVPKDVPPPYILVIDGTRAIDRNTGVAPIIAKLVTVITRESLYSRQPVFATPYTTIAYHMLSNDLGADDQPTGISIPDKLAEFNTVITESVGYGIAPETDIFSTPPVITASTASAREQELAVNHRAAIEALSSMLYAIHKRSEWTSDELLELLAFDLYDDGVVNTVNTFDGAAAVFSANPMTVDIANTQYQVGDIVALIDEERALVGNASNVHFFKDNINVDLQSIWARSGSNSTNTPLPGSVAPGKGTVLQVNFDGHPGGKYTKTDAMRDFNANESTEAVSISEAEVVSDPSGDSSRGKVLRIKHLANKGAGNGGFRFKARFPAADEYYMAFDLFLPSNYEVVATEKLPGLMYGTLLEASHGSNDPVPEGTKAFSVMHQLLGRESFSGLGDNKLTSYIYDADVVQRNLFLDAATPEKNVASSSNPVNPETLWRMPKGQWVRIEQRVKQNTATSKKGVGDRKDGILQQWVNGKLMVDSRRRFRTVNTMRIDGIYMYSYYGGNPGDPANHPSRTQFEYFDNFIVSTSPITH